MGRSLALRRTFEKPEGVSWTHALGAGDWLATAVRAKRRERPAALFYPAPGHHGFARPAHRCALEFGDETVPIAGPHLRAFPSGVAGAERREVQTAMSGSSHATENRAPKAATKSPSKKDLSGLMPYLRRYPGGIVFGLLTVVLMGVVGNILPLATGVMTDTLAGNPVPFEHTTEAGAPIVLGLNASALSRSIPFYAPSSRRTLGIYCLIVVLCVAIKGVLSFSARWTLIGVSRDIEFDIRNDLLKRLLILEPEFYVRNRTGELMSRATNDLNSVRMVLGPGIMYTANTICTMIMLRNRPKSAASMNPIANTSPAISSSSEPGACSCPRFRRSSAQRSSSFCGKADISFSAARFPSALSLPSADTSTCWSGP